MQDMDFDRIAPDDSTYGANAIPAHWLEALAHGDMIRDFADRIFELRPLS